MVNQVDRLARQSDLPVWRMQRLLDRYGSLSEELLALAADDRSLLEPLDGAEEYLGSRSLYAATPRGRAAPGRPARPPHPHLDRDAEPGGRGARAVARHRRARARLGRGAGRGRGGGLHRPRRGRARVTEGAGRLRGQRRAPQRPGRASHPRQPSPRGLLERGRAGQRLDNGLADGRRSYTDGMRTRRGVPAVAAALAAFALLAAGCGTPNPTAQARLEGHATGHPTASAAEHAATGPRRNRARRPRPVAPAEPAALRAGETMRTVTSPVLYTPKAPTTGTDDYRCFLLDPQLASDAFVTGFDIAPGQPPRSCTTPSSSACRRRPVAAAPRRRTPRAAATAGPASAAPGCGRAARQRLDDAPWLGAWAPGGGENVLGRRGRHAAARRAAGSSCRCTTTCGTGVAPTRTAVRLRLAPRTRQLSRWRRCCSCPGRAALSPGQTGAALRPGRGASPTSRRGSAPSRGAPSPACSCSAAARVTDPRAATQPAPAGSSRP